MTISEEVDKKLDVEYAKTAGRMLAQVKAIASGTGSRMQRSLAKLDKEADSLAGERMLPDNAQLEQTLNEYQNTFETTQDLVRANDTEIQNAGAAVAILAVTAKVFRGIAADQDAPLSAGAMKSYADGATKAGTVWNVPDAMDFATDYVNSPAWIIRMENWGVGYADLTRETVLKGLEKGWSPKYTAEMIRMYAQQLPYSAAENITRTLQLTSYRDASAEMEKMNGHFIEGKIRVAHLDSRTCITCVSLHGTELAAGERVNDHFRGRCDVFYQVAGGAQFPDIMQSDSEPGKRNFVPYQNGEEWFNALPPERQAAQASFLRSPAKLRAFRDGVPLSDFVGEYHDEVFGDMVVEKSLIGALKGDAAQYYAVNQNEKK